VRKEAGRRWKSLQENWRTQSSHFGSKASSHLGQWEALLVVLKPEENKWPKRKLRCLIDRPSTSLLVGFAVGESRGASCLKTPGS
jgi:hypothetical protein